jgi:hypothetical protein
MSESTVDIASLTRMVAAKLRPRAPPEARRRGVEEVDDEARPEVLVIERAPITPARAPSAAAWR